MLPGFIQDMQEQRMRREGAPALPEHWKKKQVSVPHGSAGNVTIAPIEMDEHKTIWYNVQNMGTGRQAYVGTYTGLWVGDVKAENLWMSDTPDEMRDHGEFIRNAEGHVLITGLGLGYVVQECLKKDGVRKVTVVESNQHVVDLVARHYYRMARDLGKDLDIILADAYTWKPDSVQFDWAWHDVWLQMSEDNLPAMAKMCRHYARWMAAPKRQDCWGRDYIRRMARSNSWW